MEGQQDHHRDSQKRKDIDVIVVVGDDGLDILCRGCRPHQIGALWIIGFDNRTHFIRTLISVRAFVLGLKVDHDAAVIVRVKLSGQGFWKEVFGDPFWQRICEGCDGFYIIQIPQRFGQSAFRYIVGIGDQCKDQVAAAEAGIDRLLILIYLCSRAGAQGAVPEKELVHILRGKGRNNQKGNQDEYAVADLKDGLS